MSRIIFASPGLGKSYLVKSNPRWIDCDSVIERAVGKPITELCTTPEWSHYKSMILDWWREFFPTKNLVVGKVKLIKYCSEIYLHPDWQTMQSRVASPDRTNPVTNWDCKTRHDEYIQEGLLYKKAIISINYLTDVINKA